MNNTKKVLDKTSIINKLKSIKGIEYILIAIICLIIIVYFFSTNTKGQANTATISANVTSYTYAETLENKLCNVLSKVQGAGAVSVMVTLEGSSELILATSTEEKNNTSSGTSNSTQSITKIETPIIVNNSPLVVMEYYPKIKGIVVVAQGASNVRVRLELLKAVQTLIDIDANNIEILIGE